MPHATCRMRRSPKQRVYEAAVSRVQKLMEAHAPAEQAPQDGGGTPAQAGAGEPHFMSGPSAAWMPQSAEQVLFYKALHPSHPPSPLLLPAHACTHAGTGAASSPTLPRDVPYTLSLDAASSSLAALKPNAQALCAVRLGMLDCVSVQLTATHAGAVQARMPCSIRVEAF